VLTLNLTFSLLLLEEQLYLRYDVLGSRFLLLVQHYLFTQSTVLLLHRVDERVGIL
jgi:hypothetical protein